MKTKKFQIANRESAREFIELQEGAGDLLALDTLFFSGQPEPVNDYIEAMVKLNNIIMSMETGDLDFDMEIDELYRNGIGILIERCKNLLKGEK